MPQQYHSRNEIKNSLWTKRFKRLFVTPLRGMLIISPCWAYVHIYIFFHILFYLSYILDAIVSNNNHSKIVNYVLIFFFSFLHSPPPLPHTYTFSAGTRKPTPFTHRAAKQAAVPAVMQSRAEKMKSKKKTHNVRLTLTRTPTPITTLTPTPS